MGRAFDRGLIRFSIGDGIRVNIGTTMDAGCALMCHTFPTVMMESDASVVRCQEKVSRPELYWKRKKSGFAASGLEEHLLRRYLPRGRCLEKTILTIGKSEQQNPISVATRQYYTEVASRSRYFRGCQGFIRYCISYLRWRKISVLGSIALTSSDDIMRRS